MFSGPHAEPKDWTPSGLDWFGLVMVWVFGSGMCSISVENLGGIGETAFTSQSN